MKQAVLYKKEKTRIRCLACSHKCLILPNKTGICGVRKNINNELYLLVYGRVISMAVDPIEKKPLYKFLPGSKAFSIGTIGCNFKCDFCQNYDISQASKQELDEELFLGNEVTCENIVEQALETECKSIAYTYNEPAIFIEFVKDVAKLAKEKGLKNILVTNGYMSKESFEFVSGYIDAMNIDLKGSNDFYKKYCGATLQPVLDTIKRAYEKGIHIEITTLLIPDANDSEKQLEKIAKFIASIDKNIVWHISRFFPKYRMMEKQATKINSLKDARKIGEKYLNNVYLGNI